MCAFLTDCFISIVFFSLSLWMLRSHIVHIHSCQILLIFVIPFNCLRCYCVYFNQHRRLRRCRHCLIGRHHRHFFFFLFMFCGFFFFLLLSFLISSYCNILRKHVYGAKQCWSRDSYEFAVFNASEKCNKYIQYNFDSASYLMINGKTKLE